jgi:hypothetical protein
MAEAPAAFATTSITLAQSQAFEATGNLLDQVIASLIALHWSRGARATSLAPSEGMVGQLSR